MIKQRMTYQMKRFITLIVVWEVLFWLIFGAIINSSKLLTKDAHSFFSFQEPHQLQWLWLILPIALIFLYNSYKTTQITLFSGSKVKSTILKTNSSTKSFLSYFFFRNALVFLIIALAQPAFGKKKVAGTIQSMELVICLDVSNSMNTKDIDRNYSRLAIAKRSINELINKLSGEKIGISIFANDAFTQLPLTLDYYGAKLFVNEIETNMMTNQGTNIKSALENAYSMFTENDKMSKAVVLITDGENHETDPSSILKQYQEKNIQLAVLGIGTRTGGLVPEDPERPEKGFKKDAMGVSVQSKLNPQFIQQLASQAGGIAMISENAYPDLKKLLKQIAQMQRVQTNGMDFEVEEQRYQLPLALAILSFMCFYLLPFFGLKRIK
ncbi:MAG: VWA domain-containing protein [Crocinitomicaceae bacterium]|nr:VWA domain-containing protein [Crocinitomicaceae bacterium]